MSILGNLKIEAEVDHNIPNGSIVYFNNRYKKWYKLNKGYSKNSHKSYGIKVENGIVTQGIFKLTADSEIGRLVSQNSDGGDTITIKMGKNAEMSIEECATLQSELEALRDNSDDDNIAKIKGDRETVKFDEYYGYDKGWKDAFNTVIQLVVQRTKQETEQFDEQTKKLNRLTTS